MMLWPSIGASTGSGVRVYSLCGSLPLYYNQPGSDEVNTHAYPNPFTNHTTIAYQLPQGCSRADLIISDMNGEVIKKYTVTNAFNTIELSVGSLPTGTYTFSLSTSMGNFPGGKMIKVE